MVGRAEIDPRRELPPVRQQVGVAQHDAFRRALRARGEQDRGRVGGGDAEPAVPRRGEARREQPVQLVGEPELRAQILEPDDLDRPGQRRGQRIELRQLDKAARGDDGAQLGGAAGRQHGVRAGGMVQHRRHAAGRLQPEKRDAAPIEFGTITPTASPLFGIAGQPAADHQARRDDAGRSSSGPAVGSASIG